MDEPTCSCGCGQLIPRKHLFRYKEPFLLRGHVPQEALICECGCGQPISWKDHYRTNRPHRLPGHRSLAERAAAAARRKPEANPAGLCLCGCGNAAPRDRQSRSYRYISGHNSYGMKRGEGRLLNAGGYVLIYAPDHPWQRRQKGYALEHRLVMERHLGRRLDRSEHVHHRNGVKTDNRLENLELVDRWDHGRKHGRPRRAPVGCRVDGCLRRHNAKGFCVGHYERWRKYGDPLGTPLRGRPPQGRSCDEPDCVQPHLARGKCRAHYRAWYIAERRRQLPFIGIN